MFKAIKNKKEIKNMINAHISDGLALTKFLYWIKNINKKKINEFDAQNKLEGFRKKNKDYLYPSFNTIAGAGSNGAIIHYRANKSSAKKIKKDGIKRKQVGLELDCKPLEGPNTTFWTIYKDDKKIGKVTSAIYSPRLKKNIALAMIEINQSNIGNKFKVKTNDVEVNCVVVEKPFFDPRKKIASS